MAGLVVQPLNSTVGARVTGIDFRSSVSEAIGAELQNLLWSYGLLVFPDQNVTPDDQGRFISIFAEPAPQPVRQYLGGTEPMTVLDPKMVKSSDGEPVEHVAAVEPAERFGEFAGWHSDSTFAPEINAVATLRAEIIPPVGGDTCWASMTAAFDGLSPMMQGWLEGCEAIHWYPTHFKSVFAFHRYGEDAEKRFDARYVPWRHPVVVRHPVTNRKSLFVNPVYTVEIVGLTEQESHDLLMSLFRHSFSSRYTYRHHWSTNDLVVWDELTMCHLAPQDFAPHPRRMIRFTGGVVIPEGTGSIHPEPERPGRVVRVLRVLNLTCGRQCRSRTPVGAENANHGPLACH